MPSHLVIPGLIRNLACRPGRPVYPSDRPSPTFKSALLQLPALLVMASHAQDLDNLFLFKDLMNQMVLNVDAA
jgi:hypothetical protein